MVEPSSETTVDPETGEPLEKIVIDLPPDHWCRSTGERFWARRLDDSQFEIRNVPWFAYGVNWGDIVRCQGLSPAGLPQIVEVVTAGGHSTLRIMFDADYPSKEALLDELHGLGGSYESADDLLYSIDVEPGVPVEPILDYLARASELGGFAWETGW